MFILQDSTPRIVKFGNYAGCPCGGTHVADVADIGNLKVDSQTCPNLKNLTISCENYPAQILVCSFCEVDYVL
jgi:Ser-tRNA(Ala) deacylase AlaX